VVADERRGFRAEIKMLNGTHVRRKKKRKTAFGRKKRGEKRSFTKKGANGEKIACEGKGKNNQWLKKRGGERRGDQENSNGLPILYPFGTTEKIGDEKKHW